MNEEKYWNLISRYLADDLSLEETEDLLQWLDDDPARAALFAELQETWDKSRNYPGNFSVDTQAAWQKVKRKIGTTEAIRKVRRFPVSRIAVAASLLLVFSLGFFAYRYFNASRIVEITTVSGERKQLVLPDGSEIWLNQSSSLTYAAGFNEAPVRRVKLTGEAFFEVVKNPEKPFIIETGQTITQVLGTSFNVIQDKAGNVKVAVLTGKVSFKPLEKPEQALILLPGEEGIVYKEGYAGKTRYQNENFLFWKNGELNFENVSFAEVVKTLEEAYQVKFYIRDTGLLQRKITTSFNQVSFAQAMDVLETLLDLEIKKSGSVYVVEKNSKNSQ